MAEHLEMFVGIDPAAAVLLASCEDIRQLNAGFRLRERQRKEQQTAVNEREESLLLFMAGWLRATIATKSARGILPHPSKV